MKLQILVLFTILCGNIITFAQTTLSFEAPEKPRLIVLTDITNEPDDQESLVRLLVYSNQFDLEGLIATTSTHLRQSARKDKILELIDAYEKVKNNLEIHEASFPTADYLRSITTQHLPVYSMEGVGEGKDSPGSELIIQSVDKPDDRPVWISVWGGANCLAQALWKIKNTRTASEISTFISKIKVYSISDQDFAGQWIRNTFPDIFYIVDPSAGDSWKEYYKATWTGISGDLYYKNGPGENNELVSNPWLQQNIRENHGPLGAYYLKFDYIMEGDTPSFLGLIQNGLAWYKSPAWGGWGGRYEWYKSYAEAGKIWTSTVDTQDEVLLNNGVKVASNQATIWRWREAYQNDFAARMDWNVTGDYSKTNHNPIITLNGNKGKAIGTAAVKNGETVTLNALGSSDPDNNVLSYRWFIYKEASKLEILPLMQGADGPVLTFIMPELKANQKIHLILEVKDNGTPALFSYRRVVLTNN